jgi:hypothetical protein
VATKKITQLPTASAVLPTDLVPIVDLNDTMTEKATWSQVVDGLNGLIATLSGSKFSGPVTASVGVSASFFQVGPSPATAGAVRLGNALGINANKDDGSANFSLLKSTFLNDVVVSEETNPGNTYVFGGVGSIYNRATTHYFRSTDGVTTFATMGNGGISGSLTRLTNGTSYLVAGANTTIVTQSNGSVLITATGGTAAAGGSTGDIQYNNLGALDGVSGFSYNGLRILMSTPLTASNGLSASYLNLGHDPSTTGVIRLPYSSTDSIITAKSSTGADVNVLHRVAANYYQFGQPTTGYVTRMYGDYVHLFGATETGFYANDGSTLAMRITDKVDFASPVTSSLGFKSNAGISASYINVNSSDATGNSGFIAVGGTNVPADGMLRLGSDTGGYRDIIKIRQNGADWSFLNIHNAGASYINVGPTPNVGYAMTWRGYTHLFHGYDGTFDFYRENNGTYPLRMAAATGATFSVPVTASVGISGSHGSFGTGHVATTGLVRLSNNNGIFARKADNSADLQVAYVTNLNEIVHGGTGVAWSYHQAGAHSFQTAAGAAMGEFSTGGLVVNGSAVVIGTNPAQAGTIRLANLATLSFRNAANTFDVESIRFSAGNNLVFGNLTAGTGFNALYLRVPIGSTILHQSNLHRFQTSAEATFADFSSSLIDFTSTPVSTTGYIRVNSTETGDAIQVGNNMWIVGQKLAGGKIYLIGTNAVDDVTIGTPSNPGAMYVQGGAVGTIYNSPRHYFRNADHSTVWADIGGTSSDLLKLGANPAQSGLLRLANAGAIKTRNAANGADNVLVESDSSNNVFLADSSAAITSIRGTRLGGRAVHRTTMGLRLSLTNNTPVPTTDVTGTSTLYLTPHESGEIALIDSTLNDLVLYETAQISITLSGLVTDTNYDVFAYWTGSAVALELTAWSSATTRTTSLTRLTSGILVRSGGDGTRRFVGTIRTTSTTTTEDSYAKRFVWNHYNRVRRPMKKLATFDGPVAYSGGFRAYNNDATHAIAYVCGEDTHIEARAQGFVRYTASDWGAGVGIGVDSTTLTSSDTMGGSFTIANAYTFPFAEYRGAPGLGYHILTLLQVSGASVSWYGDGGFTGYTSSGIVGSVFG